MHWFFDKEHWCIPQCLPSLLCLLLMHTTIIIAKVPELLANASHILILVLIWLWMVLRLLWLGINGAPNVLNAMIRTHVVNTCLVCNKNGWMNKAQEESLEYVKKNILRCFFDREICFGFCGLVLMLLRRQCNRCQGSGFGTQVVNTCFVRVQCSTELLGEESFQYAKK